MGPIPSSLQRALVAGNPVHARNSIADHSIVLLADFVGVSIRADAPAAHDPNLFIILDFFEAQLWPVVVYQIPFDVCIDHIKYHAMCVYRGNDLPVLTSKYSMV